MADTNSSRAQNLIGQRFGRLVVIGRAPNRPGVSNAIWLCRCDCGNESEVRSAALKNESIRSCGCLGRDHDAIARKTKHGMTSSREYRRWAGIKQRCNNPNDLGYKNYGGRGIRMCDRWNDSFENFLEDMGEAPPGMSIDRIDNDGDYDPSNCQWATPATQHRNRRNNHRMTARGKTMILWDWHKETGANRSTVLSRLRRGWTDEEAIFGRGSVSCGKL